MVPTVIQFRADVVACLVSRGTTVVAPVLRARLASTVGRSVTAKMMLGVTQNQDPVTALTIIMVPNASQAVSI